MKKRTRNLEIHPKMTFLPPKLTSLSVPHNFGKTHFPSIDATISPHSISKFFKDDESNNTLSNSTTKAIFSNKTFPKKRSTMLYLTSCNNDFTIKEENMSDLDLKKYAKPAKKITNLTNKKKNFPKSMNLNLEKLSLKKLQNSVLSTTESQSRLSKTSKIPSYIFDNKAKINLALQMKEPLLVLEYLFENMAASIQLENLDFLCETLNLIGEFYLLAHDIKNAVYSFNNLAILADMTGNHRIKIDCYRNLSNCCKKLKKYDYSDRFLKKALHYAWHYFEDSQELLIYDELGLNNYLIGDLSRAKYYHERFVNSQIESESSPCRFSSEKILLKIFEYTRLDGNLSGSVSVGHMTALILTRLGLNKEWNQQTKSALSKRKEVEEKKENFSFFYKRIDGEINIPIVKFFTNLDADLQLESIFQGREFQYDLASPRYPIDKYDRKKFNLKGNSHSTRNMHTIFNKTVNRLELSKKKPKVWFVDDPMKKNISLEEKIKYRMNANWKDFNLEKQLQILLSLKKQEKNVKEDFCLYNHLTPNRNLMGFDYHFSSTSKMDKIKKYYEKIYEYDCSSKHLITISE